MNTKESNQMSETIEDRCEEVIGYLESVDKEYPQVGVDEAIDFIKDLMAERGKWRNGRMTISMEIMGIKVFLPD